LYENELLHPTPALPKGDLEFPEITIAKSSIAEMEEGFTIFNPRRRIPSSIPGANKLNKSFGMLTIIDHYGEVLWYYKTDSRISDFDLLPNGNISYMTQDSKIVEIDFAGKIINKWFASNRWEGGDTTAIPVSTLTFHHDASLLSSGNRLALSSEIQNIDNYFTSETDISAPRKQQMVMGDVVIEFSPQGEVIHRWHAFDHLPVFRMGYETFSGYWERRGFPGIIDWSHANAVVPVDGEDAYLINFRYQSAMVKVDRTTGEINWIFAEPSGWGEDLEDKLLKIKEEDWSWHQHSPRFTSGGNLLFFNNNNYLSRPFETPTKRVDSESHVIEYSIDVEEMTAEKVWTSQIPGEQKIASIAMGGVSELPLTGNILAGYGMIISPMSEDSSPSETAWTMVREFKHTTPAEVVWEMRLSPRNGESKVGWTLFGAERISMDQLPFILE
jgi:arylsulfate sulfotransferase